MTKPKRKPRPKLTDAERQKRFVEMAREVQASEDPKDFEAALTRILPHPSVAQTQQNQAGSHPERGPRGAAKKD